MGIPVTNILFRLIFFFFFLFQIMQTFQFLVASAVSHMERRLADKSGFISIDCGLAAGSYYNPSNRLYYTSDENYISTGKNYEVSSTFYVADPQDLYTTLRSFPEGLRNCYTLSPLKPNNTYLIRTRFMYGNYDAKNSIPGFDVYIGVNFWFTLAPRSAGYRLFEEIIHVATTDSIDVCLVNTGQGTPFISALELRPLGNSSYPASHAFSLMTWSQEDVGHIVSQPGTYGVQDDAYYRLWYYTSEKWLDWVVISANESVDVSQDNPCKVPNSVLMTACVQNETLANKTLQLPVDDLTAQFYVYWHFAELELLGANQTREFTISVPGYTKLGPISPKYLQVTTISSPRISLNGYSYLYYTLEKTEESSNYPILNGLEVYTVLELPTSPTNQDDGNPDVCKSYPCEVSKKRHNFIIPVVTCVALVSLLVIIGILFLVLKRRKKPEGLVDRTIKSKNKQFKSSDIVRITDNFRKVVGKGGFGTVYYGVLQDNSTQVAVKILNNTSSTITLKQFCAEAELLTRIHHVNLVSLIGYCDEPENMALVYELMCCGNLQMHLSETNEHPLSWKARLQISIDAAQGLEYLHSGCRPPIIHRDIKPANILLDEMGRAKIADFGLSRLFTTNSQGVGVSTDFAGTQGYLDPEYWQLMNALSEKSDVYAFGIVLLQLLTGQPALIKHTNGGNDPIHIDHWVSPMIESGDISTIVDKRLQGDLNVNSAWKFLEIAMECVKPTGNQRPRMSEVVADLKLCYASEGFAVENHPIDVDSGNYTMNSSQALEHRSLVLLDSLPSAR